MSLNYRSRRSVLVSSASLLAAAALAACGEEKKSADKGTAESDSAAKEITVFAAASLNETFKAIGAEFEKKEGIKVNINAAGSTALVTQLEGGAPADVLATANMKTMKSAQDKGLIADEPKKFATNGMVIAVAAGNPKQVEGLKSLTGDVSVVRCAPQVPCGTASDKILKDTNTELKPVSEENSVTDVLTKVTTGQADAGLVYATDIKRSGGKAEAVGIPEAEKFLNTYPIAEVKGTKHAEAAKKFIDFVLSDAGQKFLADAGFGKA